MAITYFNSASTPADNGAQAGPGPVAVTPPSSMVAGDLVILVGALRARTNAVTVSATGGQTWNTMANGAGAPNVRLFWCRYNGTWSANPSLVEVSETGGMSVVMHVFRPSGGNNVWAVDVTEDEDTFSAPSTPFTVTRTGITTLNNNAVALAVWATTDDNTWGSLSGAGWAVTGSAQYRNTQGLDMSLTFAHYLAPTTGATGNVSKNQATLGGDAGVTWIASWYESAPTLTAATGAFTLTGQAAALRRGFRLTAAAGTFALTGQDVALERGYRLTAAAGSFALSGQDVTLEATRALALAAGTFALTGQAASIERGFRLVAGAGSFALAGQDVTLTYTPNGNAFTLTAATGSFTLSGQAVTLRAARQLALAAGSCTLTGQAAGLRRGFALSAAAGSHTLTGQALTFRVARQLALAHGAFALTGQAVTFTVATASLAGYAITDRTAPRYALTDGTAPRYPLTGRSAPRYPLEAT